MGEAEAACAAVIFGGGCGDKVSFSSRPPQEGREQYIRAHEVGGHQSSLAAPQTESEPLSRPWGSSCPTDWGVA